MGFISTTVAIFFVASGLLPIILNWNFDTSDVSDKSFEIPLQKGIMSIHHQFAMIACLASFYPLAAELITDSILLSSSQRSTYGYLSQWLLVLGITFPNIVIFSGLKFFQHNYYYIPWLFNVRSFIIILALFSIISKYGTPIWTERNTGFIIVLSSAVCGLEGVYVAFIGYWIIKLVFSASSWAVADGDFLAASNCHYSIVGVLVLVFEG
eukprot:gene8349-17200_t